MAEDYIDELDDSLEDIEEVQQPELYEHFRVVVDKGRLRYVLTSICLSVS